MTDFTEDTYFEVLRQLCGVRGKKEVSPGEQVFVPGSFRFGNGKNE